MLDKDTRFGPSWVYINLLRQWLKPVEPDTARPALASQKDRVEVLTFYDLPAKH